MRYNLCMTFKQSLLEIARELRKNQTPAEKVLWECLRDRKLAGLKFYRQKPIDRYVADFYCPECKLVVEVDGDIHTDKNQKEHDLVRDDALSEFGITILRFRNGEILRDANAVLSRIAQASQLIEERNYKMTSDE